MTTRRLDHCLALAGSDTPSPGAQPPLFCFPYLLSQLG